MAIADRVARRFLSSEEDFWITREEIGKVCPTCASKMASLGVTKVRASSLFNDERLMVAALQTRGITAAKWEGLPKGWTQESLKKYWDSLTGEVKHRVSKCIEKLKGSEGIDDPGAFCAALADKMEPGWRSNR